MTVLAISRDWGVSPAIVRMDVSDSLATLTTAGYLTSAAIVASIEALNAGNFTFLANDLVLIYYGDPSAPAIGFFTVDFTNNTFVAAATVPGSLSETLPSGDLFVGSAGNIATARALSGDATITNTGVMSIANAAVTSAKVSPLLEQYIAVPITATQFKAMSVTPFQLIAAPGANKVIIVKQMVLAMTFVSAAYANGGVVLAQYDTTATGAGVEATIPEAAADFFAVASTNFRQTMSLVISPFTTTVNKSVCLSNKTAPFITGDSTFVAHLWYSIIPTV